MTRVDREAKRPFKSLTAQIAAMALRYYRREWDVDEVTLNHEVRNAWRAALDRWQREDPERWTEARWNVLRNCHSSIFWTPKLLRVQGRRPVAKFCSLRWLCPFCYSREIVSFLRPFENRRFSIFEEEAWAKDLDSVEQLWSQCNEVNGRMAKQHDAIANWRYIGSAGEGWLLRTVWLYPGPNTFQSQDAALGKAFAYPIGFLECELEHIEPMLTFMHNHKGRVWAGRYRKSRKGSDE